MKKIIYTTVMVFLYCAFTNAQTNIRQNIFQSTNNFKQHQNNLAPVCMSDEMKLLQQKIHPESLRHEELMNQQVHDYFKMNHSQNKIVTALRSIPVVVHIVHNNGPENISDAQVMQGIQDLNDAFANANSYHVSNGVNTGITFCLASQDEAGNPFSGIIRTVSPLTNMVAELDDANLKGGIFGITNGYLVIWLVNEITSQTMGSGVAGYATLPGTTTPQLDGIVNEARWFGSSHDNSKVHIHEVGHYLGLYHTFQGTCVNNDCLADGDKVCDTPPDASTAPVICSSTINTCNSDEDDTSVNNPFRAIGLGGIGDQPDMFTNYMDYGYQTCQTNLTQGQADRMTFVLTTIRNSLLQSDGCANACGVAITSFANQNYNVTLNVGDAFVDTAHTQASVVVGYEWLLGNSVVSTDTIVNYVFNTIGNYELTFKIYNVALQCFAHKIFHIAVVCPLQAALTILPNIINANDTVYFSGNATSASSFQWMLDGQLISSQQNFTKVFAANGKHFIYLIASNGICNDTSNVSFFAIGDCNTGEFNNWYMPPNNSLTFNTGNPVNLPPGAFGNIPLTQYANIEGCAAISDRNGNLLFYADGIRAYNRNNVIMTDSLLGGPSSTQGVLIVPFTNHTNKYYVFTVENGGGALGWYPTGGGFSYSIVDMDLDSGRGAFTALNTKLLTKSTEQLTAIKHCNGHDVWVITRNFSDTINSSNEYYSYLITDNGIQSPVVSAEGYTTTPVNGWVYGAEAILKFSPKGNKLVSACLDFGSIEYCDFDNNTGVVSNSLNISSSLIRYPYAVEFSPDGTKLYVHGYNNFDANNRLYQYDLSSQDAASIVNSIVNVGTFEDESYSGLLQLAPDGKVYGVNIRNENYHNEQYLCAIRNPDVKGVGCNFNLLDFKLAEYPFYALPNIIISNFDNGKPEINGPAEVCTNSPNIEYNIACGDSNAWIYKGNGQIISKTSNTILINFGAAGIDTLIAIRTTPCFGVLFDTLFINIRNPIINLGNDTSICQSGSIILSPGLGYVNYLWNNGNMHAQDTVYAAGIYSVTVSGIGGCTSSDSIVISTFNSTFSFSLGNDIYGGCNGTRVELKAPPGNYLGYLWGSSNAFLWGTSDSICTAIFSSDTAEVWLRLTNLQGCTAYDTLKIFHYQYNQPTINLGNDTTICNGQVITLDAGYNAGFRYVWPDGSTNQKFTSWLPGTYILNYYNVCNFPLSDTINISASNTPQVFIGNDTLLCPFGPFTINPSPVAGNYLWQDGTTGNNFVVNSPGDYWLAVSTINGCYGIDTIHVQACVAINENDWSTAFALTPNPASTFLNIEIKRNDSIKINQLQIRNIVGQLIYQSQNYFQANISQLATGIYIVELITDKGNWIGKFVKQ